MAISKKNNSMDSKGHTMFDTLVRSFLNREIRIKMLMTLLILLIYRVGCFVPLPGLNPQIIRELTSNDFMSVLSTITGGSLQNGTLFALGIIPFINAFIIMQLLSFIIPKLKEMSQDRDKREQLTQITKYVSILLAIIQGIGIVIGWNNQGAILPMFNSSSNVALAFTMILVIFYLTAGSCLVMWLSDRLTEHGVGNGSSLIIFVGILSGFFTGITGEFGLIKEDATIIWRIILYLFVVVIVFAFIVFVDLSERRIPVTYGSQMRGNKQTQRVDSYIPMKVNAGGVMPIIFASSFLMFPQLIASFWPQSKFYIWWSSNLGVGSWAYAVLLALLILFFSFFYAKIQFDPAELSRQLQMNGGIITGIRQGENTGAFLDSINKRITLFGAIFLAIISLIPSLVFSAILSTSSSGLVNAFSATGMLIVVSVALEFNKSLEILLMNNVQSRLSAYSK